MITYIKLILSSLSNFVKLPANKQLVYFMLLTIVASVAVMFKFYNQYNELTIQDKHSLNLQQQENKKLEREIDSLYNEIAIIKIANLNKELFRADSMLKESHKIQNSINPLIKKINKKINEVHN
jgi:hypothetical protein